MPAEPAGGERRMNRVQVGRRREDGAGEIGGVQLVGSHDGLQQLLGSLDDGVFVVGMGRSGSADSSAGHSSSS